MDSRVVTAEVDAIEQLPAVQKLFRCGYKKQAIHVYQDTAGKSLYWRIRLKNPITGEKWIRPVHRDSAGAYQLSEPKFSHSKPLYRLFEIHHDPTETVWLVEGEWCADHLLPLGLIATTSGGSSSITNTDWSPLQNRKVIIWPDNDVAGAKYAQAASKTLQKLNCQLAMVDVSQLNLPSKGDCVDWLQAHPKATREDILALPLCKNDSLSLQNRPQKIKSLMPTSFTINDKGVFYIDEQDIRWICSKLEIKALVRDRASENWGRLLEFVDADGQSHTWAMPMEMLKGTGEELRGELLRLGLDIAAGNKARNLLLEYITTTKPEARARCVTRTGWYQPVFVLPNQTIGETDEQVIYQSQNLINPYQQRGTLNQWQQQVAAYCAGNSRLVLAVSCAFAALLLFPGGVESGGIHLVGESSTGKTTALQVAASVYGASDYVHRWRATANGLEALATLHSDTLFILDELSQVDPKEAGEIAYMLANGKGKARATKNGTARSRYEWRLLFLSAGEISLAQYLNEIGKKVKAGQAVRLVDIPADAGCNQGIYETLHGFISGAALSKRLVEAAIQHYGTAAVAFLEKITRLPATHSLPATLQKWCYDFIKVNLPPGSEGQVHRVCERFALISAAGELATDLGITGWVSGEANQAAMVCFSAWLQQRGDTGNQERTAFLTQVQAFFEANGSSRFEDIQGINEQRIYQRVGYKQVNAHGITEYFVLPQMYKHEICSGFDPRWATKCLLKAGMLKPSSEGKAQTSHRLPKEGLKKCYHFVKTSVE